METKPNKSGATQATLAKRIDKHIEALTASEKITKSALGAISRDILVYLVLNGGTDIACVNRLDNVLTPMNRKTARIYFKHFLPFKWDEDKEQFTGRVKGEKKLVEYWDKADGFLADKSNDIWTWAADNVKLEEQKPYAAMVARNIKKALNGEVSKSGFEHQPISAKEVLQAIVEGGLTTAQMMDIINDEEDETAVAGVVATLPDQAAAAVH